MPYPPNLLYSEYLSLFPASQVAEGSKLSGIEVHYMLKRTLSVLREFMSWRSNVKEIWLFFLLNILKTSVELDFK
jgi:hypothetical protein